MSQPIDGVVEDDEMRAVWAVAFSESDLPTLNLVPDVVGLGCVEDERFATEMLANAGINVELLGDFDDSMVRFDFLQVICEDKERSACSISHV